MTETMKYSFTHFTSDSHKFKIDHLNNKPMNHRL